MHSQRLRRNARRERGGGYFRASLSAFAPIHLAARVRPARGFSAAFVSGFGSCFAPGAA